MRYWKQINYRKRFLIILNIIHKTMYELIRVNVSNTHSGLHVNLYAATAAAADGMTEKSFQYRLHTFVSV